MKTNIILCLSLILVLTVSFPITKPQIQSHDIPLQNTVSFSQNTLTKEKYSLIDNYTWAVMRYDNKWPSENYNDIMLPTPSNGVILIPANMMSVETCNAAVSVFRDSKMETLDAFDEYISKRMLHINEAFLKGNDEWNTESCYNYRKESAIEMNALGDICLKADLIGDCQAQASFNTAVLRLSGFSAEEVFTVGIQSPKGGHAVNVVNVDTEWYVIDSTFAPFARNGKREGVIFESYYRPPITDYIILLENDKYFINFGHVFNMSTPTQKTPYSNMNPAILREIITHIQPLFNNSLLGNKRWNINSFIENATPNPWMKTVGIPHTVKDAEGTSLEEKAIDLAEKCQDFICYHAGKCDQNQFDKSRYALGMLSVEYPQVYANAAKLAAWTSWYGIKRDMSTSFLDVFMTGFYQRITIRTKPVTQDECIAYSDLLHLRHAGSTIDKAVLSYGTLRNMKKDTDFWQPEDLFVLITEENQGYLAVNLDETWQYLSFNHGKIISDTIPSDIMMVFNEVDYFESWEP